jgi:hypothetical protein
MSEAPLESGSAKPEPLYQRLRGRKDITRLQAASDDVGRKHRSGSLVQAGAAHIVNVGDSLELHYRSS